MLHLIIDLQFGSTGKGLLAGVLALQNNYDTVVTAWAPNAGHTFIERPGAHKFVHTMLANGIVSKGLKRVLIGPGSLIDPVALEREIEEAFALGYLRNADILIHPHAAVVLARHRDEEAASMTGIGSTKKGVGAAMIDRIRRRVDGANVAKNGVSPYLDRYLVSVEEYNDALDRSTNVLVEGAQGFSLSMYHGFYPYCTSRDVTPAQILADCAIPLKWAVERGLRVYGTLRTFPIRVANRYDENGLQIGWSGPSYVDQRELQWSELGLEPELTTVTKLPRRIFEFSEEQTNAAFRQCQPDYLFLNFVNYCRTEEELLRILGIITAARGRFGSGVGKLFAVGLGPTADDVFPVSSVDDVVRVWRTYRNTKTA